MKDVTMNPTDGFQYEENRAVMQGDETKMCGFWDVGGGLSSRMILAALTQNVRFNAIICVIDITKAVKSVFGGVNMNRAD